MGPAEPPGSASYGLLLQCQQPLLQLTPQSLPHTLEQVRANLPEAARACLGHRRGELRAAAVSERCTRLRRSAGIPRGGRRAGRHHCKRCGCEVCRATRCGLPCEPRCLLQHAQLLMCDWPGSLPERSAVFVRAFVDAFVQQKTSDGYEVVDSRVAAQPEGEAAPSPHSPKPSSPTEGEAAGTGAAQDQAVAFVKLRLLKARWLDRCGRLRRGVAGLRAGPEPGASAERASVIRMGPAHALRQHLTGKRSCRDSLARCAQEPKGQTSIEKLARHFHLPINAAGRELGICPTVLKKICRKHGLTRWPHRKVCAVPGRARLSVQGSSPVGACLAPPARACGR